ncbi:hypothetical protein STEG23_013613 [Scotinomys teguina]
MNLYSEGEKTCLSEGRHESHILEVDRREGLLRLDYNSQKRTALMASTPVQSQERTAPVLILERATEPHALRVLPGARGLCTLDQTPRPALS